MEIDQNPEIFAFSKSVIFREESILGGDGNAADSRFGQRLVLITDNTVIGHSISGNRIFRFNI